MLEKKVEGRRRKKKKKKSGASVNKQKRSDPDGSSQRLMIPEALWNIPHLAFAWPQMWLVQYFSGEETSSVAAAGTMSHGSHGVGGGGEAGWGCSEGGREIMLPRSRGDFLCFCFSGISDMMRMFPRTFPCSQPWIATFPLPPPQPPPPSAHYCCKGIEKGSFVSLSNSSWSHYWRWSTLLFWLVTWQQVHWCHHRRLFMFCMYTCTHILVQ